jgi:hypothetical protein
MKRASAAVGTDRRVIKDVALVPDTVPQITGDLRGLSFPDAVGDVRVPASSNLGPIHGCVSHQHGIWKSICGDLISLE